MKTIVFCVLAALYRSIPSAFSVPEKFSFFPPMIEFVTLISDLFSIQFDVFRCVEHNMSDTRRQNNGNMYLIDWMDTADDTFHTGAYLLTIQPIDSVVNLYKTEYDESANISDM